MSRTYLNLKTGLIEYVSNKDTIAQCNKHPEVYKPVTEEAPKFIKVVDKNTKETKPKEK